MMQEKRSKPWKKKSLADGTASPRNRDGFGQWVSKSLVERYDGRITVDSPAGGGVFTLWLRCEPLA